MTNNNSNGEKVYAGIDIGTNTTRLILGRFENSKLITLKKSLIITRLGSDFHKTGIISASAAKRTIDALTEFSAMLKEHDTDDVTLLATGVLRRAQNAKEFADAVYKEAGYSIEIISGEREARLTALGVKSACMSDNSMITDIGGGSTEFIVSEDGNIILERSFDIGVVTLYEPFINNDPPGADEITAMSRHIHDVLAGFYNSYAMRADSKLIFTAGTATTLAAIKMKMREYDPDKINNCNITYEEIKSLFNDFIDSDKNSRSKIIGLEKGREDIIISGTAIMLKVMEAFNKREVTICDASLLEGIIIDRHQSRISKNF